MVSRVSIKDWNKEIIYFLILNFIIYLKRYCFPALMVPGTDLNGTGYQTFLVRGILPLGYSGTFCLWPSN